MIPQEKIESTVPRETKKQTVITKEELNKSAIILHYKLMGAEIELDRSTETLRELRKKVVDVRKEIKELVDLIVNTK